MESMKGINSVDDKSIRGRIEDMLKGENGFEKLGFALKRMSSINMMPPELQDLLKTKSQQLLDEIKLMENEDEDDRRNCVFTFAANVFIDGAEGTMQTLCGSCKHERVENENEESSEESCDDKAKATCSRCGEKFFIENVREAEEEALKRYGVENAADRKDMKRVCNVCYGKIKEEGRRKTRAEKRAKRNRDRI